MGITLPEKPKNGMKSRVNERESGFFYEGNLPDYPKEDVPPPPSEDLNLFHEAWKNEKHVKLKFKKE